MAGQPLQQVSRRGCGASVFRYSKLSFMWSCAIQFWWFCFELRSLLGPGGGQGWNCGLNFQRLFLPTSMIMWNWEQKAFLSVLCFSVASVTDHVMEDHSVHSYILWVSAENRQHKLQLNLGLSRVLCNLAFSPIWIYQFKLGADKCVSVVFIQLIYPQITVWKSSCYR